MARLTQEQLLEIFNSVKKEMLPYEKGNIKARINIEGKYDLWSEKKDMFVYDRTRNEIGFVTLILQSTYVGFYYMPIYTNNPYVRARMPPELMKLLKGKACFHIKSTDKTLMNDIKAAMKVGYEAYKKMGWL